MPRLAAQNPSIRRPCSPVQFLPNVNVVSMTFPGVFVGGPPPVDFCICTSRVHAEIMAVWKIQKVPAVNPLNSQRAHRRAPRARRIVFITIGSVAAVLGLGLGAILTTNGIFVPATYLQPWSAASYQQFTDARMQVVAHAVLAPSGHNNAAVERSPRHGRCQRAPPLRRSEPSCSRSSSALTANVGLAGHLPGLPPGRSPASDPSATTENYASLFKFETNRSPYTAAPLSKAQTDGLTRVAENCSASLAILSDRQDMTISESREPS